MFRIPFLNNAFTGKNDWWRYLVTIILTWGASSLIASFIIGFILIILLLPNMGALDLVDLNLIIFEPLFIILVALITFALAFLILYLCLKFIHQKKFISIINIKSKLRWKRIGIGALAWLGIILFFDVIFFLIDPDSFQISFDPQLFWIFALLSLITFPIQATFEEVFFRGYLIQGLALKIKKPLNILLLSSFIFAFLHWWNVDPLALSISITVSAFIIGLMLGIITLADDGIELAIGMHVINNLYVTIFHSSPQTGLGELPSLITSPLDPYRSPLIILLASIAFIFILFRNRKEKIRQLFK